MFHGHRGLHRDAGLQGNVWNHPPLLSLKQAGTRTTVFAPQVANVKKETSFHWFKEDDEIVPEDPPNVLSGACSLPLPLVTTGPSTFIDHIIFKNRKF